MPRKLRQPKPRINVPLTPAWTFALMTGRAAAVRVPGWVEQAQSGSLGTPTGAQMWEAHGAALTAEARTAGFAPFYLTKRTPKGADFEAWRARFLAAHRY